IEVARVGAARFVAPVAHVILAAAALGFIVAKPRSDFVARAVEEAAVIGIVASAARIAAFPAVGTAVVAPSRTFVARVESVISHGCSPCRLRPAPGASQIPEVKRTGVHGRSCCNGSGTGQIGGPTLWRDRRLQG